MSKKNFPEQTETAGLPNLFNNTGYRREIQKTDKVDSNYFEQLIGNDPKEGNRQMIRVEVPSEVTDIEQWLHELILNTGYNSWEEIIPKLALPAEKRMVIELTNAGISETLLNAYDTIKCAAILSKCNKAGYDPDSSMIFSHKRINRSIDLVFFNLKSFYELD
jgi:hypothetical protein